MTTMYTRQKAEAAQKAYHAGDAKAAKLVRQHRRAGNPGTQAKVLTQLATTLEEMGRLYPGAWGPDPDPDEGRDQSEILELEALIVRVVADAESAVATGRPRQWTTTSLERAAGPVLDCIAATNDLNERKALLFPSLYDAVKRVTGDSAAEILPALAR